MTRPLEGVRLLVAEDEYFMAEEIAASLADAGAVIVGQCPTATAALAVLGERAVDAAVLDVMLLDDSALRVADELLARDLPFVFVTGAEIDTTPPRHLSAPVVMKPTDLDELVAALAGCVAGRRPCPTHAPRENASAMRT